MELPTIVTLCEPVLGPFVRTKLLDARRSIDRVRVMVPTTTGVATVAATLVVRATPDPSLAAILESEIHRVAAARDPPTRPLTERSHGAPEYPLPIKVTETAPEAATLERTMLESSTKSELNARVSELIAPSTVKDAERGNTDCPAGLQTSEEAEFHIDATVVVDPILTPLDTPATPNPTPSTVTELAPVAGEFWRVGLLIPISPRSTLSARVEVVCKLWMPIVAKREATPRLDEAEGFTRRDELEVQADA